MNRYRLLLLFSVISFTACDEIENPVTDFGGAFNTDLYEIHEFEAIPQSGKNVLVEDFTAHQCGNCPPAAVLVEEFIASNNNKVFGLAIHAGSLASTSENYPTDWTCETGDDLWSQLDFQANPVGRINRKANPGDVYSPGEWSSLVEQELMENSPLELQIATDWIAEYNHLNIHVFGQYFSNEVPVNEVPVNHRLSILVSESHLIGDQLDYSQALEHVYDYEFNHLLRSSLTGAEGLTVIENPNNGGTFQSDFTYDWNSDWAINNCQIIAIVSDENGYIINCLGQYIIQ